MRSSFWQRHRRFAWSLPVLIAAIAWYNDVLSVLPNRWADQASKVDDFDRALGWLAIAEVLHDGNPETSFLQARIARKLGSGQAFKDHLLTFVQRGGSAKRAESENILAAAATGQAPSLMAQLADLLVSQTVDGDEVCSAFSNGFFAANDLQQGFVLIQEWKTSFPDDPRPYYANARVRHHLSNQAEAEKEYRAALDRTPDHYPSAYALGRLLLENNHPDDALTFFRRCLSMKHGAAARIEEAKCLRQTGDIETARRTLEEITAMSNEDLATSFQRVSETIEGRPDCAEFGSLLVSCGQAKESIAYLERALKANPRDLDVRYTLGIALRETGRIEEGRTEIAAVNAAREELTRADRIVDKIDLSQPFVEERLQIGEIYLQHGSLKTAEFWLLSAASHEPRSRKAMELLARLYTTWSQLDPSRGNEKADAYREQIKMLETESGSSEPTDKAEK